MRSILIILFGISILCCQNRTNLINSHKENNRIANSIFSVSLIQDSLDYFIKSMNQYKVYTISCDEIYGYKRLIFWAGKDIQMRIENPLNNNIQLAGGIAKKYEAEKIIAIDTISLRLLRGIVDTTGFTNNLYICFTNKENRDKLIVRPQLKIYKLIDMERLESM